MLVFYFFMFLFVLVDVNFGAKCDVGITEDTIRESVALLSAKNIDFVRRNSYGDLSMFFVF